MQRAALAAALANLLTAGDTTPVVRALERMLGH